VTLHDVLVGLAGVLEELLVVRGLRERLLLLLVERLLDLGVGHLDALVLRLALDPLERDQQAEHLVAQLVVLLLTLLLEVGVGLLGLALGRLGGRLLGLRDAFRVVRRHRHLGVGPGGLRGDVEPVLVGVLLDGRAIDLGYGIPWDPAATGDDRGGHKKGAQRQDCQLSSHDRGAD
jgi:hypothetical protein